ncbi:hypothetical protein Taro_050870, partial [Colocasia esculenta]|nr:hypothetical protein [Colocasia esculenta]
MREPLNVRGTPGVPFRSGTERPQLSFGDHGGTTSIAAVLSLHIGRRQAILTSTQRQPPVPLTLVSVHRSCRLLVREELDVAGLVVYFTEVEKNSEVKRAQLGVVPGWVTFLGSLPTGTVVGPVCWLGRHKWYQSLAQPEVQELSATQGKVLRYGSHLLRPYFLGS